MDGKTYVDMKPPFFTTVPAAVTLSTSLQVVHPLSQVPFLPPEYFAFPGKTIWTRWSGVYTTGTTPGGFSVDLYLGNGAASNGTLLTGVNFSSMTVSLTNYSFIIEAQIKCRAIGTSGTLQCSGWTMWQSTGNAMLEPSSPPLLTVDTTQGYYITLQVSRTGSTAESVQMQDIAFFAMN